MSSKLVNVRPHEVQASRGNMWARICSLHSSVRSRIVVHRTNQASYFSTFRKGSASFFIVGSDDFFGHKVVRWGRLHLCGLGRLF